LLWDAINKYNDKEPFNLIAWVILPDHWHLIVEPKQNQLSTLMKNIKLSFAQCYLKTLGTKSGRTWQNRFWNHMIRDDLDMNRHLDYIHYNSVKHGLSDSPIDYDHSSFGDYVDKGMYSNVWGTRDIKIHKGEYGE